MVKGVDEKFAKRANVEGHELDGDVNCLSDEEVDIVCEGFVDVTSAHHTRGDLGEGSVDEVRLVFFWLQRSLSPVVDQVI